MKARRADEGDLVSRIKEKRIKVGVRGRTRRGLRSGGSMREM